MGVTVTQTPTGAVLTAVVDGSAALVVPGEQPAVRTDNLWTTTCIELFLNPVGSDGYVEFNFSPSCQWAAYWFDRYRSGVHNLTMAVPPGIRRCAVEPSRFTLEVTLDFSTLVDEPTSIGPMNLGPMKMGLSAVIEERDGTKSYWALAHAPGAPDFHNRDCFIAALSAPALP